MGVCRTTVPRPSAPVPGRVVVWVPMKVPTMPLKTVVYEVAAGSAVCKRTVPSPLTPVPGRVVV